MPVDRPFTQQTQEMVWRVLCRVSSRRKRKGKAWGVTAPKDEQTRSRLLAWAVARRQERQAWLQVRALVERLRQHAPVKKSRVRRTIEAARRLNKLGWDRAMERVA